MAGKFGATHLVDSSKEDLVKKVKEITNGRGADVVIVAAPSAETASAGTGNAAKGGQTLYVRRLEQGKIHGRSWTRT